MAEVVLYIPRKRILKSVGLMYKSVLKTLIDQGVLNSYEDVIELRFDKAKALHIQSILEFYEVREASSGPIKQLKKED